MSDNEWAGASCADPINDPDWFDVGIWEQRAKRICAGCPIKNKCLAYALENQIPYLIWGGLSPDERKRIRIRPLEGKQNGK